MKPTNYIVWHVNYDCKELLQWWADEEGYGEWRDVETTKYAVPNPPEGYKGKWEKAE